MLKGDQKEPSNSESFMVTIHELLSFFNSLNGDQTQFLSQKCDKNIIFHFLNTK